MHGILNHHEIVSDLTERCLRLAESHRLIFGNAGAKSAVGQAHDAATDLAANLAKPGGNATAQAVLHSLVPELERRGTDFWGTPLGRACAWWTGAGQVEPTADQGVDVSTPIARLPLLLGMTRQSAHEMVTKGKLRKNTLTGVSTEDVRLEMQRRYPLDAA